MRSLICIFLLLLFGSIAVAQDTYDTHGKTEAQILAMGMEQWSDFYTSKEGTSTASMTQAAGIYGDVARKRNDLLLKEKNDAKVKDLTLKLRKLLGQLASSSVDIGYAESGGETMYNPMWASVSGVVEDTLYSILTQAGAPAKKMVVSTVTRQLAKVRKEIEAMHRDDKNNEFFKYDDAKKSIANMQRTFEQIVTVAKTMSRADSDRLLAFCYEHAKNASSDSSK
jgi:hypothetical protein